MRFEDTKIDLICQHCMDGRIIPIKFRVLDEDGNMQEYKVKGYRDTSDKVMHSFDCNVIVNGIMKTVTIFRSRLYMEGVWHVKVTH